MNTNDLTITDIQMLWSLTSQRLSSCVIKRNQVNILRDTSVYGYWDDEARAAYAIMKKLQSILDTVTSRGM